MESYEKEKLRRMDARAFTVFIILVAGVAFFWNIKAIWSALLNYWPVAVVVLAIIVLSIIFLLVRKNKNR